MVKIPGCQALKETAQALFVLLPDGREMWMPKSVIHEDSDVYGAKTMEQRSVGVLVIEDWWAETKGLDKKIEHRGHT